MLLFLSTGLLAGDIEYRSKPLQRLVFKLTDYYAFYLENEFYVDYKEMIVDTPAIGNDFNLGSIGDFSFEAALIYMHIVDQDWKHAESRIRSSISAIYNLHGFKIGVRNRWEYRFRDSGNAWRARPRIKLKTPWKWTALKFSPYLSDEFFITKDGFDSQEIETGFGFGYGSWGFVLGDIFVLKQGQGYVENILIIETKYKIDFTKD
jgi:hypothetical protein